MLMYTKTLQNSRDKMEISVTVVPNSKKCYRIRVDATPVGGKANKRLIEILSVYFDVDKSSISIKRGIKSRKKIIKIDL